MDISIIDTSIYIFLYFCWTNRIQAIMEYIVSHKSCVIKLLLQTLRWLDFTTFTLDNMYINIYIYIYGLYICNFFNRNIMNIYVVIKFNLIWDYRNKDVEIYTTQINRFRLIERKIIIYDHYTLVVKFGKDLE